MLIKCTKKLLDEIKVKPCEADTPDFYSWHANITIINRHKAVILINDATRTVVLLYGLKAAEFKRLDTIIVAAIKETVLSYGINQELTDKYITKAGSITYTKTDSKSILGHLNHVTAIIPYYQDKLKLTEYNQRIFNERMADYMFIVNDAAFYPKDVLLEYMASLEAGEAFEDEKTAISKRAFQLKVRILLDDFDVWRRIIVPSDITFKNLHFVLQDSFNWLSYHLYNFMVFDNSKDDTAFALITDDEEAESVFDDGMIIYPEKTPISDFLPKYKKILYSYDYGDGWEHNCEIEKVIDDYSPVFSTCIDGNGDAPPDDVGGEGGFTDFLTAVNDKNNPEHENMTEWGKMQKFKRFDIDKINKKLLRSLKRRR